MTDNRDAAELFAEADRLYEKGDLDSSLATYQEVAGVSEFKAVTNYNMGCILALKGKHDDAMSALGRAVKYGFMNLDQFETDTDLESLRDDARFVSLISQVSQNAVCEDFLLRAKAEARHGNYEASETLCLQALDVNPDDDDAATNLGYALHMQGRFEEALPWHERAAASEDFADLGNYNLCCYYSLKGEKDKAFGYLNKAIENGATMSLGRKSVSEDADLDNIRDDERFNDAIAKFDSDDNSRHTIRMSRSHEWMQVVYGGEGPTYIALLQGSDAKGNWEGELRDGIFDLTVLRTVEGTDGSIGYMIDLEPSDFSPEVTKDLTGFKLQRKCGTVSFTGSFTGRFGQGEFSFSGDDAYREFLINEKGIESVSDALLFRMFFSMRDEQNVIANLQELQKLNLDGETLQALMIDGVSAHQVEDYLDANLSVKDHLLFVIWRVEADMIVEYNEADLDVEEHKNFINQRVPADLLLAYIREGFDLNEHKRFIASRVEPELLQSYNAAGFDVKEYGDFIDRRVPPKLLSQYSAAGLDLKENGRFIGWRVEPRLLKSYTDLGLSLDDYGEFINQRVPADLLKSYMDAGLELKKHQSFIQSRVDVGFLNEYVEAGLSLDGNEGFIQSRIPARMLLEYEDAGFDPHTYENFLQQRIDASLLKAYEAAGLSIDEHKGFIRDRVDPETVLKYLKQRDK